MHAIPAARQVLREGDLISIDCGAILDGWHGDAAITVGVGETDPALLRMAEVAGDAMWAGIAAAAHGVLSGTGRLTDALAAAGLLDEYRICTSPVIKGGGEPLFRPASTVTVELVDTKVVATGAVVHAYRLG